MDRVMVLTLHSFSYLIVRGLESISFDRLFMTYQQDQMVINFTKIIVTSISESALFPREL